MSNFDGFAIVNISLLLIRELSSTALRLSLMFVITCNVSCSSPSVDKLFMTGKCNDFKCKFEMCNSTKDIISVPDELSMLVSPEQSVHGYFWIAKRDSSSVSDVVPSQNIDWDLDLLYIDEVYQGKYATELAYKECKTYEWHLLDFYDHFDSRGYVLNVCFNMAFFGKKEGYKCLTYELDTK